MEHCIWVVEKAQSMFHTCIMHRVVIILSMELKNGLLSLVADSRLLANALLEDTSSSS